MALDSRNKRADSPYQRGFDRSLRVTAPGGAVKVGTSLGTGPIPIDTRKLDLSPDDLLLVSTSGFWPGIFSGYRGVIDKSGKASATINIPNVSALVSVRLHAAFVTLDPASPSGVRSISNTDSFTISK